MIKGYGCKDTEKLFNLEFTRKFQDVGKVALRKLELLYSATSLGHLRVFPANRLESLKGKRKGQHSIRINRQWRVCFRWYEGHAYEGHAYDVEIVDYH